MAGKSESVKRKRLNERLDTVFRKAKELSVYTASEVAAFIQFPDGKLREFASDSMQDIKERFQRDTGCYIQDGRPIKQDNLQQIQPDQPLTDENVQRSEAQSNEPLMDESVQHSSKVLGLAKSDKRRIVDSCTDEELHEFEQLLKQSMISLLDRQPPQTHSGHPLTDESVQKHPQTQSDEPLTNENVQPSAELVGLCKWVLDLHTDEEMEEFDPRLKQSMSPLEGKNGITSSAGSRESEEFQSVVVDSGSMGVESSSGPQESNKIEFHSRETQGMEVDTELRLGFPQWRA